MRVQTALGDVLLLGDGVGTHAPWTGPRMSIERLVQNISTQQPVVSQKTAMYLNGLFTPFWFWWNFKGRCVLAPRGMASPSALAIKKYKKKIYLTVFRTLKLHQRVCFHTTSDRETKDVQQLFGSDIQITQLPNFSYSDYAFVPRNKEQQKLQLISVATISPLKNLHLVANALQKIQGQVHWRIIGAVLSEKYFRKLQQSIAQLPKNVQVTVLPPKPFPEVVSYLDAAHLHVIPSESENFGHAHFEGMVRSVPLLSSFSIPWQQLQEKNAGVNVSVKNSDAIREVLQWFTDMSQSEWEVWANGARNYAMNENQNEMLKQAYVKMFFE